jgi:hypothetical protein
MVLGEPRNEPPQGAGISLVQPTKYLFLLIRHLHPPVARTMPGHRQFIRALNQPHPVTEVGGSACLHRAVSSAGWTLSCPHGLAHVRLAHWRCTLCEYGEPCRTTYAIPVNHASGTYCAPYESTRTCSRLDSPFDARNRRPSCYGRAPLSVECQTCVFAGALWSGYLEVGTGRTRRSSPPVLSRGAGDRPHRRCPSGWWRSLMSPGRSVHVECATRPGTESLLGARSR